MSCGSSSMLCLRKNPPSGAIRGSFLILNTGPVCSLRARSWSFIASAFTIIVRNLKMLNGRPWSPTRAWRKKMGPLEVSLIRTATLIRSGERITSAPAETKMSKRRLTERW